MKRHIFILALVLVGGASGCEQTDGDYVRTDKGDVIRREDAASGRESAGGAAADAEETPGFW